MLINLKTNIVIDIVTERFIFNKSLRSKDKTLIAEIITDNLDKWNKDKTELTKFLKDKIILLNSTELLSEYSQEWLEICENENYEGHDFDDKIVILIEVLLSKNIIVEKLPITFINKNLFLVID